MPRSSRHKSSKHSSRDVRDYSDSEDECGSTRERRAGGEEGKRRVESKDSKDVYGSGNGDHAEDRGSSRRRKDKFSDGVSDRWNGGDFEGSNRSKPSSESKSRRRDDENEDVRRSGKSERHRESSRKVGRESGRNEREGKAEKMDEQQEIDTDSRSAAASESENFSERRTRKRRESFDDRGKYQYDVEDTKDRHAYSGDDAGRGGRQKDEKLMDEQHRDKYRESVGKDSKNRYDKQKDGYHAKDRNGSRSNEKYLRDEKDIPETRPKKSKSHDSDRDVNQIHERGRHRDRDKDRGRDSDQDRDRDHEHDPDWDQNHNGDRNRERNREWAKERERDHSSICEKERDRDWERGKEKDRDQERERDHDHERDYGDRGIRYKDHRGKKRSPEDRDDYYDSTLRDTKPRSSNMEMKSSSSTRIEVDDRDCSPQHEGHLNNVLGSSRSRASPTSWSQGGIIEYRHEKDDDPKYRDSSKESRLRAHSPKESAGFSGHADIGSKYTPFDKYNKMEDGHFGHFAERSLGSKASPRGLTERSPSSSSLERSRSISRPSIRWNPDSDETRRRIVGSTDGRDLPVTEGRLSRELSVGRHSVDESSQADSSFNSKSGPSNSSSLIPPQPPRRNNDPNLGRGHGNWRGYPNWSSPVPSGFAPFPHGPPHGNFPAMMPHFPAPPLFGVRPPMEINQSGLPYHMGDADRFHGHLRPIGWQNMIDASGIPPFHGWERSSGLLREEPHLYQGPDWDQNRHLMNIRGWESNSDHLKGQNGDLSADMPLVHKREHSVEVAGDDSDPKDHGSTSGSSLQPKVQAKNPGGRHEDPSLEREVIKSSPQKEDDLGPVSSESTGANTLAQLSRAYLSKLDISTELADPELYEQCLTLVGGEQAFICDGNSALHIVGEGHGNAVQDGSLSGLLLPAIDDSVFQKAMDHYKKQRLEPWSSVPFINLGPLGMHSFSNGDKVDEQDHALNEDKKTKMMEDIDKKMPNSSLPTSDEMSRETLVASSAGQKPDCTLSDRDAPHSANVSCQNTTEGPIDGTIQLMGDHGALSGAKASSSDTRVSTLLVNEGSRGEVPEALMPNESNNESEMENLSRIHRSPESTH